MCESFLMPNILSKLFLFQFPESDKYINVFGNSYSNISFLVRGGFNYNPLQWLNL